MKSGEVEAAKANVIEADGRSFNAYADMVRNATFERIGTRTSQRAACGDGKSG